MEFNTKRQRNNYFRSVNIVINDGPAATIVGQSTNGQCITCTSSKSKSHRGDASLGRCKLKS
jgi:ABC-type dipeptide/oligopeptide/nickel transport system ATPase component